MSTPRSLAILLALTATCVAGAPAARAEGAPPRSLTLAEAVRLAGEHSWEVRKALESKSRLEGVYRENRAAALPRLELAGHLSRSGDGSMEELALPEQTGSDSLGLTLTQPLFTWGRISAAIRAAELGLGLWEEDREIARQAAVRDATVAFLDLLLAQELDQVARENLAQKTRLHEEASARLAAGTATEYDQLVAEVSVRNARPEVIRTQNLIRLARERLGFLVGVPGETLEAAGSLDQPATPVPPFAEALAAAGRRPELARFRRSIGVAEQVVKIRAAGNKPSIDFQGNSGWKDLAFGDRTGGGTTWSAKVALSFPLYDGRLTAGQVAQAESEVRDLQLEERRFREELALELKTALSRVQEADETLKAVAGTIAQAERLLAMSERGLTLGVKTRIEVDAAALSLTAARVDLAQARRDALAARASLDWVTATP